MGPFVAHIDYLEAASIEYSAGGSICWSHGLFAGCGYIMQPQVSTFVRPRTYALLSDTAHLWLAQASKLGFFERACSVKSLL